MNLLPIIKNNRISFAILSVTVMLSILFISLVQIQMNSTWQMAIGILGPGIVFSSFILYQRNIQDTWWQSIGLFLMMNVVWVLSFIITLYSWGLASPFIGAYTAFWIVRMTSKTDIVNKESFNSLLLLGGITSLIGLLLYYFLSNYFSLGMGVSTIGIVGLWQFVVGVKVIEMNED
jgi:hypothetical protein